MKTKFSLFLFLAMGLCSFCVNAQNGWVPPVYLNGSNQCDYSSWKLVFFDDFNGNQIDRTKWNTYQTWDGMSVVRGTDTILKPDHPDWGEARKGRNSIYKDANVIVNSGTCKILMRNDPNCTWTYRDSTQAGAPLTTITSNSSTGTLTTPYLNANGTPNYFNSGKFESKIKFPTFRGAWCAFWVWNGAGVNEIDFSESWGENSSFPYLGARDRTQFNLHAWMDKDIFPPYGDVPGPGINYPGQDWWDFFLNKKDRFRQDQWHIYTCDWDTTSLTTYLDNVQVYKLWKYYQTRVIGWLDGNGQVQLYYYTVGANCTPQAGMWKTTFGYPFNNNSQCQLRLDGGFSATNQTSSSGAFTKGQMEIDYVKVWQKHPERDGHKDLCAVPFPVTITGPSIVCGSETYVATNTANLNGTWSVSSWGNALAINSVINTSNTSSALVSRVSGSPYESAIIQYKYTLPGCPEQVRSKIVDVSTANSAIVSCTRAQVNSTQEQFSFTAIRPYSYGTSGFSPTTYEWDIDYGAYCVNRLHYHGFGQYVATPYYTNYIVQDYCIDWTLKITNACGTITKTGHREYHPTAGRPAGYAAFEINGRDTVAGYFQALITDSPAYEQKVAQRVSRLMFSEEEAKDDVIINNAIGKIRMEELEPYLLADDPGVAKKGDSGNENKILAPESRLYPNPANNILFINPGHMFNDGALLAVEIHDLMGKLVKEQILLLNTDRKVMVDIDALPAGNYIVILKQEKHVEHHKISKIKE